jgi:DNA-binding response OmpR family regulator
MEPIKVFVLSRDAEVLESVLQFFRKMEYEADGETENEKALAVFPLKKYDIVVIGGGVDGKTRILLKKEFPKTSPDVEFVEHTSPPADLLKEIEEAFGE